MLRFLVLIPSTACSRRSPPPASTGDSVFRLLLYAVSFLFIYSGLASNTANAGAGSDRLNAFFSGLTTIQADFTQTVKNSRLSTVQETHGRMFIDRPDKFRWDYLKPYEQQIIGDGNKVWLYDVDLEQVTIKRMNDTLGSTPALLLSSRKPIANNFNITELGAREGYEWLKLAPKTEDTSFEYMLLAFDERNLQIMEIIDNFGQTTRLQFNNIKRNPGIDPDLFVFKAPKGVDVIQDEE